jgi:hypothetical protein
VAVAFSLFSLVDIAQMLSLLFDRHGHRYMTTSSSIAVKQAAATGTKLVRNLISNKKNIFLTKPLTYQM